jgi:hypothetical protein
MKKVTLGRSYDCDIIIGDKTDRVSRHQAIIVSSFFGKMRIYDESINGTYVNGNRVPKPEGMPIKKSDKINFCQVWDFDWNTWKDPYIKLKKTLGWTFLALLVIVGISTYFLLNHESEELIIPEEVMEENIQPAESIELPEENVAEPPVKKETHDMAKPNKKSKSISIKEKVEEKAEEEVTQPVDSSVVTTTPFFF